MKRPGDRSPEGPRRIPKNTGSRRSRTRTSGCPSSSRVRANSTMPLRKRRARRRAGEDRFRFGDGDDRLLDASVRDEPVDGSPRRGLQIAVAQQELDERELRVDVASRRLDERRGGRPGHQLTFDAPPRRPANRLRRPRPRGGQLRPQRGVLGDDVLVRGGDVPAAAARSA